MNATPAGPLNIFFVEAYASGSHGRVIDLLKRYSMHNIEDVRIHKAHWAWLALAGHIELARIINQRAGDAVPDLMVFSGGMNVGSLLAMLPARYQRLPRVVYFHESQWSYPNTPADPRPYLIQHLDAVHLCDESWFNSRYHLEDFWRSSMSTDVHINVRAIASRIMQDRHGSSRVVYPPINLDTESRPTAPHTRTPSILWNARWERDKRPVKLVELLDILDRQNHNPALTILGTAGKSVDEIQHALGRHSARAFIPGHLTGRTEYEHSLAGPGIVVSTAEHEFFGIAVLESVLAGRTPVLPYSLSYPETLPSAWFYAPDDAADMARVVTRALENTPATLAMHLSDALRFHPQRIVPIWDAHFSRVVRNQIARP